MNQIPRDPFMLLSYINMQLRDYYPSLEAFCQDRGLDPEAIAARLNTINMRYCQEINQFR